MKIIHCADLHLSSPISSFSKEYNKKKKAELLSSFARMCSFASRNNIPYILLSGDVFDKDKVSMADYKNFSDIVKEYSDIIFFYLRGNHDIENSLEKIDNLYTFSSLWQSYDLDKVVVSGIEINEDNKEKLYSDLSLDKDRLNIVMLHGDFSNSEKIYSLNKNALKNKNIDYLALGHIHYFYDGRLDSRTVFVNPGCLEGRDFGESGEKGFVLLSIDEDIKYEFISFSSMVLYEHSLDITGISSSFNVAKLIKEKYEIKNSSIYRFHLTGEIDEDSAIDPIDIMSYFEDENVYILQETTLSIDINKYINDTSIKGEYVRLVLNDKDLTEDEKKTIISLGLQSFTTKGADLKWK